MALEISQDRMTPLLASVLSLAALHWRSVGLNQSELGLARLRYASIKQLRIYMMEDDVSNDSLSRQL